MSGDQRETKRRGGWTDRLVPPLAAGLGWGIRGQFGGELGAAVAGALVGLGAGWLSKRRNAPRHAAKLGATGALACSFGGMMTYGQTLGLVHDRPSRGQEGWGLLGLAVKGGAWFGLTGLWLGVAGGPGRYRWSETAALAGLTAAGFSLGALALNSPMQPPAELPAIYFSKRFDPEPRIECWGGLWGALAAGLGYVLLAKRDRFATGLALCGVGGGAAGFVLGELLQWWGGHAAPLGPGAQRWIDWWKVMEVTFGAVAGAGLGWGLRRLESREADPEHERGLSSAANVALALGGLAVTAALFRFLPPARNMDRRAAALALAMLPAVTADRLPPWLVLGSGVTLAGGLNVYEDWVLERGLVGPVAGAGLLASVVLGAAALAYWRRDDDGWFWLPATAWAQVGLTVALMLPKAGWRSSAGIVELIFVLAAAGLTGIAVGAEGRLEESGDRRWKNAAVRPCAEPAAE